MALSQLQVSNTSLSLRLLLLHWPRTIPSRQRSFLQGQNHSRSLESKWLSLPPSPSRSPDLNVVENVIGELKWCIPARRWIQGGCNEGNEAVTPIKYLDCPVNLKSNNRSSYYLRKKDSSPVNSLNSRENGVFWPKIEENHRISLPDQV